MANLTHFREHDSFNGNGSDAFWYQFCSDVRLSPDVIEQFTAFLAGSAYQSGEAVAKEFAEWIGNVNKYMKLKYDKWSDGDKVINTSELYSIFKNSK